MKAKIKMICEVEYEIEPNLYYNASTYKDMLNIDIDNLKRDAINAFDIDNLKIEVSGELIDD